MAKCIGISVSNGEFAKDRHAPGRPESPQDPGFSARFLNERSFARLSAPNTAETARQARHLQNHERTGAHPPMHHGARPRQAPPGRPPRHGGHGQEAARPSPVSGINPCVPRRCAAPSEEEGGASLRGGFLGSFGPPVAEGKQWLLLPRREPEGSIQTLRIKQQTSTVRSPTPTITPTRHPGKARRAGTAATCRPATAQ